jgi:hypothetical protein
MVSALITSGGSYLRSIEDIKDKYNIQLSGGHLTYEVNGEQVDLSLNDIKEVMSTGSKDKLDIVLKDGTSITVPIADEIYNVVKSKINK